MRTISVTTAKAILKSETNKLENALYAIEDVLCSALSYSAKTQSIENIVTAATN